MLTERVSVQQVSTSANGASSICSRIASWATATPDEVALVDEHARLTYKELERQSSMLAAQLRETGAAPDRCVGVFLDRSTRFVVSALAVLKSGAAYVPIDPSTPIDRVSFILNDAGAVALLTQASLARNLTDTPYPVIDVDGTATGFVPSGEANTQPDTLAYVVYTSGSTGEPKGVEITHANLCNLIAWHESAFGVTAADRASQVAGLGFDAVGWEVWPYLAAGASVYVADESTRRSPEALRDWIVAHRITIGFVPTILAEQLLSMSWPHETALRTLLTGGDRLNKRPPAELPFVLVNNYGPTECTVVATSGIVSPSRDSDGLPSIGRPIENATAMVLDDALNPVPQGKAGELCIGGALVGRGYRNLPHQTASRFVTYVAPSGEPLRIYRTGDSVRLLENGEIEFLGRLDDQVKIRGYRIELGEIIAQLNRCPGIEISTVCVRGSEESGPALAAYIVARRNARLTEGDVRDFLAARLPDYMIPASFVAVSELPVTVNGKLDASALPAPTRHNLLPPRPGSNGVANQSSVIQDEISAIVVSLLGRPLVDPQDNFFMIGGHSMLGVQLVARIRETFGVKLSLRQLFLAPTISALSNEVCRLTNAA